MKEKILIVSNYYPPEKGAAANRIEQLALKLSHNNYEVSVVCPLPNYPDGKIFKSHRGKFSSTEQHDGITVKRLWIYPSNSKNILVRIISILSFSVGLFFFLAFQKTPHKVIVQSPPLLLSFISVFVLRLKSKKIILNVSDLWPLAAVELGAIKTGTLPHRFSLFLERYIYRNATVVLGQSEEIIAHIREKFPDKPCYLYRNYPDHISAIDSPTQSDGKIKLFYAGLLGVAQGVVAMCDKIDLPPGMELHIFGNGAEKNQLETLLKLRPEKQIHFHGMLERTELLKRLSDFDVAVVPLKTRIYGSVPSKIFEYSALGIPILYFGGGEGNKIVAENNLGWIAEVGDYHELNQRLQEIFTIGRPSIHSTRNQLKRHAAANFSLEAQISGLIAKGVF